MRKIRIGIMGAASIAQRSMIPAIQSLSKLYELVGIASRSKEKANQMADKFGCEPIYGYEELIERTDIDAVYMPLPTGLHKEWVLKSLSKGKHIYVEKSMAKSYSDCQIMVDVARKKGLLLMEGYMFVYHSQHQKVLDILSSGAIGDIRHFFASFGFPPFPDKNNFRYDKEIGGGALMDCAGYTIRAATLILQQHLHVKSSFVYFDESENNIYGSGFLVGDKGVPVSVSFGFDNFYQCRYEIWGNKGKLILTKAFTPKEKESPLLYLETAAGVQQIVCDSDNHFVKAMIEFAYSINNRKNESHYNDALEQSRLLDEMLNLSKMIQ
jgi:predicted dehydrogenase